MFGRKTKVIMNATAVMPLTDGNVEVLRAMQLRHEIPEGAKYIAFLEDGDACFLESIDDNSSFIPRINIPSMHMITYYTDVKVEIEI